MAKAAPKKPITRNPSYTLVPLDCYDLVVATNGAPQRVPIRAWFAAEDGTAYPATLDESMELCIQPPDRRVLGVLDREGSLSDAHYEEARRILLENRNGAPDDELAGEPVGASEG